MNTNNIFKTILLFSLLTLLFVGTGYLIGGFGGMVIAFILAVVLNFGSFWFSDKLALRFANAKPLDKTTYNSIYKSTENIARQMQIPTPKLYLSPQIQPNAFATGRNPQNGVVCVTEGLLKFLNHKEIEGVIAHELAHIKNRDVLIATIAAVIGGTISAIADIFMFGNIFGNNDEEGSNPFGGIIVMIIAPLTAALIQFAISRSREYGADATAAKILGTPDGLINALIKIENAAKNIPMDTNPATASLYIQNPLGMNKLSELFSTHPPTEKRINHMLNLKY